MCISSITSLPPPLFLFNTTKTVNDRLYDRYICTVPILAQIDLKKKKKNNRNYSNYECIIIKVWFKDVYPQTEAWMTLRVIK